MKNGIHSPERVERHLGRRICTYIFGILLAAASTNLSVMAAIGLSAFNSMSAIISARTGVSLGDVIILINFIMVLVQMSLLGRHYQIINLAQVPFAIIYGKFISFLATILPDITFTTWYSQLAVLLSAVVILAVGLLMMVGTELVPMPVEGTCLVIAAKTHIAFHNVKIIMDCSYLVIAIVLALVFYGNLMGIGIGTVLLATGTGWTMGKVKRFLPRWMQSWHLK